MVSVFEYLSRETSLLCVATMLQITVSVIGLFPFYVGFDLFNDVSGLEFQFLTHVV
jgi:hypothetical protein